MIIIITTVIAVIIITIIIIVTTTSSPSLSSLSSTPHTLYTQVFHDLSLHLWGGGSSKGKGASRLHTDYLGLDVCVGGRVCVYVCVCEGVYGWVFKRGERRRRG